MCDLSDSIAVLHLLLRLWLGKVCMSVLPCLSLAACRRFEGTRLHWACDRMLLVCRAFPTVTRAHCALPWCQTVLQVQTLHHALALLSPHQWRMLSL